MPKIISVRIVVVRPLTSLAIHSRRKKLSARHLGQMHLVVRQRLEIFSLVSQDR